MVSDLQGLLTSRRVAAFSWDVPRARYSSVASGLLPNWCRISDKKMI
jgi:hypothetical protein